jgi:hypothetical protein
MAELFMIGSKHGTIGHDRKQIYNDCLRLKANMVHQESIENNHGVIGCN